MSKAARRYLRPDSLSFWSWEDEGRTLVWRGQNGPTIAFGEELLSVLRVLSPDGLPPLGSILLLLGATRDNWADAFPKTRILGELLQGYLQADRAKRILNRALELLDRVNRLERDLRVSLKAKQILCEYVFEGLDHRGEPAEAKEVIQYLENGLGREILPHAVKINPGELFVQLHCLVAGLGQLDPQALQQRGQTGLDELPEPADLEDISAEHVRAMLAELSEQDDELRPLANLARRLMAAVTLPRPVSDVEDIPIGGLSDLTNRGPLDRLLLSELAHDDLTLAVRVATGEALYLRRESPPRSRPRRRAILLDAGIRTWGLPRVFGTAVGLALAATAQSDTSVFAYRADPQGIHAVDLNSREGLIHHLQHLEPTIHPGASLPAFCQEIQLSGLTTDPVLVTTPQTWEDPEFQLMINDQTLADQGLAAQRLAGLYIALVGRDGHLQLLQKTNRGLRSLREVHLDLDLLFAHRPKARSLVDPDWARDYPAILSMQPFPLRLSHVPLPARTWQIHSHGLLSLTKDGRLMHWTKRGQGALQLADDLPAGLLRWSSYHVCQGCSWAVISQPGDQPRLLQIDLHESCVQSVPLEVDSTAEHFCTHQGALFALQRTKVQVMDLASGEQIQSLKLPGQAIRFADRFLATAPNQWYALAFDGMTARIEPVHSVLGHEELLLVLERDGPVTKDGDPTSSDSGSPWRQTPEGPIGVTSEGHLVETSTGLIRHVAHNLTGTLSVLSISPDRRYIALAARSPQIVVLDVDAAYVQNSLYHPHWFIDQAVRQYAVQKNLRHRFTGIAGSSGELYLRSTKNQTLVIGIHPGSRRIAMRSENAWTSQGNEQKFTSLELPAASYKLSVAKWSDGSQAFLDSRGLLHLKSADTSVPEVTLVLTNGDLSGWCSDGRLWGAAYFIGEAQAAPIGEVFRSTIQAFVDRLPLTD